MNPVASKQFVILLRIKQCDVRKRNSNISKTLRKLLTLAVILSNAKKVEYYLNSENGGSENEEILDKYSMASPLLIFHMLEHTEMETHSNRRWCDQ